MALMFFLFIYLFVYYAIASGVSDSKLEPKPETESERIEWCANLRNKYGMSSKSNTLAVLPKSLRDGYLHYCSTTPGSQQDVVLKKEMLESEESSKEVYDHSHKDVEHWCNETKNRYGVIPGQDFGSLPSSLHPLYLKVRHISW